MPETRATLGAKLFVELGRNLVRLELVGTGGGLQGRRRHSDNMNAASKTVSASITQARSFS